MLDLLFGSVDVIQQGASLSAESVSRIFRRHRRRSSVVVDISVDCPGIFGHRIVRDAFNDITA